jgi:nucleoside-diphosphate-sugar epimerase
VKVLVTGSNGLLGQEAVRQLQQAGHEVFGCDLGEPRGIPGSQIDVTLAGEVLEAVSAAGPDAILHTAGLVGPIARRRPYTAAYVNVVGTLNLLEAARRHGARRFVLCSTALVYDYGRTDPDSARTGPQALRENDPVGPSDVYGGSKLAAEALTNAYARNYGLAGVALRFTRIYGPLLERTEGAAMKELGPIIDAVLNRRELTLTLEPTPRKAEYLYVKDAARACRLAIEAAGAEGPYNIGSGEILGLDEIFEILCQVDPEAARWVRRETRPGQNAGRSLDTPLSCERAERDLGYRPQFRMREGLADLLSALRQQAGVASP